MPDFDPVIIQLKVDAEQYRRELRASADTFDQTTARMEAAGYRVGASIRNALTGAIAAVSAQQLYQIAKGALDYASSLGEVSQQLGVTTQDLQVFQYAGSQVGLSTEEVRQGLGKLTKTLGEAATGSVSAQKALQIVGFSLTEIKSGALTAGEAIPRIADFLEKVESPAQRAALEIELFGRAGQKLDTLLSGGSSAIDQLRDAAQSLGVVLSEDEIQNADDTADKLSALKQVLEANIASAVASNASSILALANALASLAGRAAQAGGAYQGFLRIVQNEGARGFFKTFFGDGSDQKEAATAKGYSAQKIREFREATATYRRAQNNPNTPSSVRGALLDQAVLARDRAFRAVGQQVGTSARATMQGKPDPALQAKIAGLNAPKPKAGPQGKSPEALAKEQERAADRADRDEAQYQNSLGRVRVALLGAQAQLTDSAEDRYRYEVARVDEDRAALVRDLALEKDLSQAKKDELLAAQDKVSAVRKSIAAQDRDAQLARETYEQQKLVSDNIIDELRYRGELTDSIKARRDFEIELIAARKQAEREYLNSIIASNPAGSAAAKGAQAQLGTLDARYGRETTLASRRNETPGQAFLRDVNRSAQAINEDMEAIGVRGLQNLNDQLAEAVLGAKSLGSAFKSVANQIIGDLIRIAIQQAIIKPLAGALLGGGGFGSLLGGIPGFATGGSMLIGGRGGVDNNMLSLNGAPIARVSRGEQLNIVPGAMAGRGGSGSAPTVVQLVVGPGQMFEPQVRAISGQVSVQTVQAAAPQLIDAATANTLNAANRPRL